MALLNTQRQYIDTLSKRWGVSKREIVNLAIAGELNLWVELYGVSITPYGILSPPLPDCERIEKTELRLRPQGLRALIEYHGTPSEKITAMLVGYDRKGNLVTVFDKNKKHLVISLDDLFADLEDVKRFEAANLLPYRSTPPDKCHPPALSATSPTRTEQVRPPAQSPVKGLCENQGATPSAGDAALPSQQERAVEEDLAGTKAIEAYFGKTMNTVKAWCREAEVPILYPNGKTGRPVIRRCDAKKVVDTRAFKKCSDKKNEG